MNSKHDVLIIGGGSIGLNCAYYLLKAGRRVTIVDAKEIGKGSSSGNAGHIVPSHIIPLAAPGIVPTALKWMLDPQNTPFGMKISLEPSYISWLLQFVFACTDANVQRGIPPLNSLGQLSARNFAQMIAEEHFDCHYREKGLLFLYKSAEAFAGGRHEAEEMSKHGIPTDVLDQAAVHVREPMARADVVGGVHFTGDSFLDPARFLQLLRERVLALGAELHEHTPVTGFDVADGKIRAVKTSAGDFEADEVILAAGAWSAGVARDLRLNIPVQPARGFSLTLSATTQMPAQALLLGERRVAVTPMGGLLRFTGRLEVGQFGTQPELRWIRQIEAAVREYIQLDDKLDIKETWAGLRPTTPDGMPIIGRSSRYQNLLLATGHAMLGLSLGPGTGQVVADLLTGRKPAFDLNPLRVERF
ncbi:MAG: FAD-dependent oxidoreductase [Chloroflexi bacterium]|nr:FAD-dependent oxidoreductase [Chloroflexota bacterium]